MRLGLAAGALAVPARAAPPYDKMTLEELLETRIEVGSLERETLFDSPSTVSVIDRETIERHGFLDVAEALRVLAGFDVGRTYFRRDVGTARGILQEHYANKILVMIEGVPAWHATTGESSLSRVDILDVERIEVLKGPASVLYGTNAYAGAVNIVLRRPDLESTSLGHGGVGDAGAFRAGALHTYSSRGTRVFVAAGSRDERGHERLFTDETGEPGLMYEYRGGSQTTALVERRGHTLLLNAFVSHESFLGTTPEFSAGAGHDHELRGTLASYRYSGSAGARVKLNAGVSYDRQSRNFSRSRDDRVRGNVVGYRASAFATAGITASRTLRIEMGGDYDHRRSVEYSNYDVRTGIEEPGGDNDMQGREVGEGSGFVQLRFDRQPFKLLAGARLTRNERFGSNLSTRGTLVYSIDPTNSLKLIFGQSYRAPALFELYFRPATPTVHGNPRLAPETSDSYELAYLTSFDKLFVQALVYRARYEDKVFRIWRDPANGEPALQYVNGAPFHANGLELELKYQSPRVADLFANYSYVDGDRGDEIARNDHYNFKYVPGHTLSAGLARNVGSFEASAVLNAQSGVEGPSRRIDAWQTFDLGLSYRHTLGSLSLRHTLSAKNVGDAAEPIPEFVRRRLNEIPSGNGRRLVYSVVVRGGGD